MKILFSFFFLCCGYYTFTFGMSLWKKENNRLGTFGVGLFAVIGTIAPIIVLFMK